MSNPLLKIIKTFFVVSAIILSFSSCQKPITDHTYPGNPPSSVSNKVKTYTEDVTQPTGEHQVVTYNLTYDAEDRLVSLISTTSPGDKFLYTYNNDNTYVGEIYGNNALSIHEVFFINSLSLVDSTFQFNDTNDSTTEKYFYNSNKQLVTVKEYTYTKASGSVPDNITTYTYDNNGNQITETDNFSGTTTFDYYPDLLYNINVGLVYFTVPKNLIKTATNSSGGPTLTALHTYTFDNNKRVISDKTTTSNGVVGIKSYTYF